MRFNDYIIIIGTGIIVIAFLAIIYFSKKYTVPYYLKYFYWFPICGLLLSLNSILWTFFRLYIKLVFHLIQDILNLISFIIIFTFFLKYFKGTKFLAGLKLICICISLAQLFLMIHLYKNEIRLPTQSLPALIIIPMCFIYYYRLLKIKPTDNLFQSSLFWIITGTLLYTCTSFTVYNLYAFVPNSIFNGSLRSFIFSFANISAIVFYFLMVKAYACLKHPQNF